MKEFVILKLYNCLNCPYVDAHPQEPSLCSKVKKKVNKSIYDYEISSTKIPKWCPLRK